MDQAEDQYTKKELHDQEIAGFKAGFSGEDEIPSVDHQDEAPEEELEENLELELSEAEEPEEEELEDADEGEESEEASSEEPEQDVAEAEGKKDEKPSDFDRLEHRLRNMEGKFGTINAQIQKLVDQATESASKSLEASGGDIPSDSQIQAAMLSGEKFESLKEEFPEWAEVMEEQISPILKKLEDAGKVDVDSVRAQVREEVMTEIREEMVEDAHPGWKDLVQTDDFANWYQEQDEKTRALSESPRPRDAIQLLDKYRDYADNAEKDASNSASQGNRQASNKRLENAVPSTRSGGATRKSAAPSEEEAFEYGFKNG